MADTLDELERIKAELTAAQDRHETVLMAETIALQARNDQLAAKLRELENEPRPNPPAPTPYD